MIEGLIVEKKAKKKSAPKKKPIPKKKAVPKKKSAKKNKTTRDVFSTPKRKIVNKKFSTNKQDIIGILRDNGYKIERKVIKYDLNITPTLTEAKMMVILCKEYHYDSLSTGRE